MSKLYFFAFALVGFVAFCTYISLDKDQGAAAFLVAVGVSTILFPLLFVLHAFTFLYKRYVLNVNTRVDHNT